MPPIFKENIDGELAVGSFIDCQPEDTVEPIRRLKAIAAERGYQADPGQRPPRLAGLLQTAEGITPL